MIIQSFYANRIGEYPIGPDDVVVLLSSTQGPIECNGPSFCTNGELGVIADQIIMRNHVSGKILEAREQINKEDLPEDQIALNILSILESGREIEQNTPEWNALFRTSLNVIKEETKQRLINCGKAGGSSRQDLFYLGTCEAIVPEYWQSLSKWQEQNEEESSFADGLLENRKFKLLRKGED